MTVNVDLENGQVLDSLGLETQGVIIPAFTRRTVRTRLTVMHGETAVLSGVLDTRYVESERGVPILRSIPIQGYAFKSKSKNRSTTELMAFITPLYPKRRR